MIRDLIRKNRSCRRFFQDTPITITGLRKYVDLARLSASSANLQPLKYVISSDSAMNELIFPTLAWAGYLKEWKGPEEGERPSAYIVILGDEEIAGAFEYDCGIAAQSILLGAVEDGFGGCIIGSVKRGELRRSLALPERYRILVVIALGKPKEMIIIEQMPKNGRDVKYWRGEDDTHHVPKRSLDEIIIARYGPDGPVDSP